MQIDPQGWLVQASKRLSPNYNERPAGTTIHLLVIHNISLPSGSFGGPYIDRLFLNQIDANDPPEVRQHAMAQVSAHTLIRRTGEIIQYVSFDLRAWHAGVSSFRSETNCNDFSIGVELEGSDDVRYQAVQYKQLAELTMCLQHRYPAITTDNIVGHEHIAPNRKTDPGPAFDWSQYRSLITQPEVNPS